MSSEPLQINSNVLASLRTRREELQKERTEVLVGSVDRNVRMIEYQSLPGWRNPKGN